MTEMEWMAEFSDTLVERMIEADISQEALAREAGLAQSTISKYINKRQMPTVRAVVNIAYVLDCDVSDLVDFGYTID